MFKPNQIIIKNEDKTTRMDVLNAQISKGKKASNEPKKCIISEIDVTTDSLLVVNFDHLLKLHRLLDIKSRVEYGDYNRSYVRSKDSMNAPYATIPEMILQHSLYKSRFILSSVHCSTTIVSKQLHPL